ASVTLCAKEWTEDDSGRLQSSRWTRRVSLADRIDGALHADGGHAAKINRTHASEAGRTGRVGFQKLMRRIAGQTGAGQFRRGAAEDRDDRGADGGGNVHRAGVVC